MTTSQPHNGPLAGLQVVEPVHAMAGPVVVLMLADMGAQVVKVEKLPGGHDPRRTTPPAINGESASFMILNRNKRGVAVDLKAEEGKELVKRRLAKADIDIEDRKSVVQGKSVSVRVDLGGRRIIQKTKREAETERR